MEDREKYCWPIISFSSFTFIIYFYHGPIILSYLSKTYVVIVATSNVVTKPPSNNKFFTYIVSNVCNIIMSQLLAPCVEGGRIVISITEEEYQLGLEACKDNLHGRIIWPKAQRPPLVVVNLCAKLNDLWISIGKRGNIFRQKIIGLFLLQYGRYYKS